MYNLLYFIICFQFKKKGEIAMSYVGVRKHSHVEVTRLDDAKNIACAHQEYSVAL